MLSLFKVLSVTEQANLRMNQSKNLKTRNEVHGMLEKNDADAYCGLHSWCFQTERTEFLMTWLLTHKASITMSALSLEAFGSNSVYPDQTAPVGSV